MNEAPRLIFVSLRSLRHRTPQGTQRGDIIDLLLLEIHYTCSTVFLILESAEDINITQEISSWMLGLSHQTCG